jgi:hypothetical protein
MGQDDPLVIEMLSDLDKLTVASLIAATLLVAVSAVT